MTVLSIGFLTQACSDDRENKIRSFSTFATDVKCLYLFYMAIIASLKEGDLSPVNPIRIVLVKKMTSTVADKNNSRVSCCKMNKITMRARNKLKTIISSIPYSYLGESHLIEAHLPIHTSHFLGGLFLLLFAWDFSDGVGLHCHQGLSCSEYSKRH